MAEGTAVDKLKTLSLGERIIAIAGVVLFIDSFLKWYSVELGTVSIGGIRVGGGSISRNGWQSPGAIWSILAVLLGLVMVAQIVVTKLELAKLPDRLGNLSWPQAQMIGGVAALVCVVIKWLNENDFIAFGFWVGFLCTIALAVGGYLLFQQAKTEAPPAPPV